MARQMTRDRGGDDACGVRPVEITRFGGEDDYVRIRGRAREWDHRRQAPSGEAGAGVGGAGEIVGDDQQMGHGRQPGNGAARACAICTATSMAANMLDSLAMPLPAMSKAVPWSTEVRMIGSP